MLLSSEICCIVLLVMLAEAEGFGCLCCCWVAAVRLLLHGRGCKIGVKSVRLVFDHDEKDKGFWEVAVGKNLNKVRIWLRIPAQARTCFQTSEVLMECWSLNGRISNLAAGGRGGEPAGEGVQTLQGTLMRPRADIRDSSLHFVDP